MNEMKKLLLLFMLMILTLVTSPAMVAQNDSDRDNNDKVAEISVAPDTIYITDEGYINTLAFDFHLNPTTQDTYSIFEVHCDVLDKNGKRVTSRHLRYGGLAPSTLTIPNRELKPGKRIVVFNPFHFFSKDIDLSVMRFSFTFATAGFKKRVKQEIDVKPVFPDLKTVHYLPVKGMATIDDGNDFYSHHRRIDNTHFAAQAMGIKTNSGRYAMDFMPTNPDGDVKKSDGKSVEDYYGFGMPVYATAGGEVVGVESSLTDPQPGKVDYDIQEVLKKKQSEILLGNHVIIKHATGEYGNYMHLKQNSVKVKIGDKVKKGQLLGLLGNSGSSYYPHLHFQLTDGKDWDKAEGLPIHFHDYKLIRGSTIIPVKRGFINTGDRVIGED